MARKKHPGGGKRPNRRPSKPPSGDVPAFPDRRAMEGSMRDFIRSMHGTTGAETPLDRAQAVVYQAFEDPDETRRAELAREALEISPDCADAWVLLAEQARTPRTALPLWEKAVAAGERALGPKGFEEAAGHFWNLLETRPYMRARLGLAHALWMNCRREEAIAHLQELLRINPDDNQGVRYTLAIFFLFLGRDDDLALLLEEYLEADSATWPYTRALLAFRQQGDSIEARRLLKTATKSNKHIPAYLTGRKHPDGDEPPAYRHGDENEALNYVGSFLPAWKDTAGAVAWLRANDPTRQKSKSEPPPRGPLTFIKKWLADHLPQGADEWQAEFRQMPDWVFIAKEPVRPWLALVTSRTDDLVLSHRISDQVPASGLLWDLLVQAMQHPMAGDPHRPRQLQVRQDERWEELRPHLDEIDVELAIEDSLDHVEFVLEDMNKHVGEKPPPGLLDVPGVRPEMAADFYAAAAAFYRQSPWKKVGYEAAIQIECDRYQSGPWYGVLMGQSGLALGLAVYENLDFLKRMLVGDLSNEESARETVATSVTFGEEWEFPVADLDASRKYGWEVARPDAYPEVIHKERGLSRRPPLAWELELMTAILRAAPSFLDRRKQDDPAKEEFVVPTTSGKMKLVLSWIVEEEV